MSCTVAVQVRMSNCRRSLPSHLLRSLSSLSLLCDCSKSYFSWSTTITRHRCSSPHNTEVHTCNCTLAHTQYCSAARPCTCTHAHTHTISRVTLDVPQFQCSTTMVNKTHYIYTYIEFTYIIDQRICPSLM